MLLTIANSLLPVFVVIALGTILRSSKFLSDEIFLGINKLVFWIGLPVLLFHKISSSDLSASAAIKIVWTMLAATAFAVAFSFVLAKLMKLEGPSTGSFIQAAFRSNTVFVGIPIIIYALASESDPASAGVEGVALLAMAPMIPVYNILSVIVLLLSGDGRNRPNFKKVFIKIATNPLLIACIAGLLFSWLKVPLPVFMKRTFSAIGQMALPLA
ncbi:MAG: AEC family transporter, partial [Planctomycetes bacterium]|nr:AEC family transporter [Planctomycetota bacterium]